MDKKKVGRPPAKWVHQLAELKIDDEEFLDYHELSAMFGVSMRTVHGFCTKAAAEGDYYYRQESKAIRKRFRVKDLKMAAIRYLASKYT